MAMPATACHALQRRTAQLIDSTFRISEQWWIWKTRHPACKKWWDGGGGHWLVRMERRPDGWSLCLPLLILPCTIKSRSSLLAPAHLGGPRKGSCKMVVCVCVCWLFFTGPFLWSSTVAGHFV